jgi:hypothetical protein
VIDKKENTMKRLIKVAILLYIPLFVLGCTTTNAAGQEEISWIPTLIAWVLLSIAVVAGAIGIGNAIKG